MLKAFIDLTLWRPCSEMHSSLWVHLCDSMQCLLDSISQLPSPFSDSYILSAPVLQHCLSLIMTLKEPVLLFPIWLNINCRFYFQQFSLISREVWSQGGHLCLALSISGCLSVPFIMVHSPPRVLSFIQSGMQIPSNPFRVSRYLSPYFFQNLFSLLMSQLLLIDFQIFIFLCTAGRQFPFHILLVIHCSNNLLKPNLDILYHCSSVISMLLALSNLYW